MPIHANLGVSVSPSDCGLAAGLVVRALDQARVSSTVRVI